MWAASQSQTGRTERTANLSKDLEEPFQRLMKANFCAFARSQIIVGLPGSVNLNSLPHAAACKTLYQGLAEEDEEERRSAY